MQTFRGEASRSHGPVRKGLALVFALPHPLAAIRAETLGARAAASVFVRPSPQDSTGGRLEPEGCTATAFGSRNRPLHHPWNQ